MATYINNNPERDPDIREGSGTGVIAGILVTALVIILFFVFGLPYIRGTGGLNTPGVPATGGTGSGSESSSSVFSTSTFNILPGESRTNTNTRTDTTTNNTTNSETRSIYQGATSSDGSSLIPDLRRD